MNPTARRFGHRPPFSIFNGHLTHGRAEAQKRRTYGNVAPHVVLPFVLDDLGGLGKEAWSFLLQCRDRAGSQWEAA